MSGLPATLSESEPEALAHRHCASCHGEHGEGRGSGAFPILSGQTREYLTASLEAYANGQRHSGIMEPLAAAIGPDEIDGIARHYARQSWPAATGPGEASSLGERIAMEGMPEEKVPACHDCHGPARTKRNPLYPRIEGQYARYLELQLELFAAGKRGGTDWSHIMEGTAHQLPPEERRAVAAWYGRRDEPASEMN